MGAFHLGRQTLFFLEKLATFLPSVYVRCQFSSKTGDLFLLNLPLLLWGPFLWGPLFGRTCWTCLNPPLSRIQPNPGNPVPTNWYPVPKPGNKSTHYRPPFSYRKSFLSGLLRDNSQFTLLCSHINSTISLLHALIVVHCHAVFTIALARVIEKWVMLSAEVQTVFGRATKWSAPFAIGMSVRLSHYVHLWCTPKRFRNRNTHYTIRSRDVPSFAVSRGFGSAILEVAIPGYFLLYIVAHPFISNPNPSGPPEWRAVTGSRSDSRTSLRKLQVRQSDREI